MWVSGATPAEAPSVRKDWRKHCASPTQDVLHPLRWGPGVYKAITNYKQENKQSCKRRLQLLMGWAHSLSVTLAQCTHLVIFKCCEQLDYKCCYCCARCSSRMFTIWLRSFSSLLLATIIGRINASTMFHRILHCYFHLGTENKGFVEKNFIDVVFIS